MLIKKITARKILNSREELTIEVIIKTKRGSFSASVPSGVSTGKYEAKSLSAEQAKQNIEKIIGPALIGKTFTDQRQLDQFLIQIDGTLNKSRLGANAILAVSIACYRAQNLGRPALPLVAGRRASYPRLCFNVLEGGVHTKNGLSIQEFMVAPDCGSVKANLKSGKKIFKVLGRILQKQFGSQGIAKGDEGGFSPPIETTTEALDYLMSAINKAGFKGKTQISLDVAGSEFYQDSQYNFEGKLRTAQEITEIYQNIFAKYPILFIEDPFDQDDSQAWKELVSHASQFGSPIIVGDDLTTTNLIRIQQARENRLCNAVVIKPNQIGTVSEAIKAAKLAKNFGWKIMVSHRGGETMDSFIADLAVLVQADFFKAGAPQPKERMVKYKRLVELYKGKRKEYGR